jgi:hypothetical protein
MAKAEQELLVEDFIGDGSTKAIMWSAVENIIDAFYQLLDGRLLILNSTNSSLNNALVALCQATALVRTCRRKLKHSTMLLEPKAQHICIELTPFIGANG